MCTSSSTRRGDGQALCEMERDRVSDNGNMWKLSSKGEAGRQRRRCAVSLRSVSTPLATAEGGRSSHMATRPKPATPYVFSRPLAA